MQNVIKTEQRKIALLMAILLAFSTPVSVLGASPKVTEVKDAGKDLEYTFTETVSEDGTTADVQLEVMEKNGNTLTEVTMPDGQVIYPETRDNKIGFKQNVDGTEKNLIHYNATKNGTVKFQLKYQVPAAEEIPQTEGTTEFHDGAEAAEPEMQQEEGPETQSEPEGQQEEEPETQSESEGPSETEPEGETQSKSEMGTSLVTKAVDFFFPAMEVHAAGNDVTMEERTMEISYDVTGIVPENKATEEQTTQEKKNDITERGAKSTTKGSITLSEGQIITSPDQLIIGDPAQENINLTVRYSPNNNDVGRKLQITIPEGFTLGTVPTMADIVTAESITKEGNVLTIAFSDSASVTAAFGIQVMQKKEMLYKNASEGARDYEFIMEGFANETEPVLSEKLTFSIGELADVEYQVEVKSDLDLTDVEKVEYGHSSNRAIYEWTITKPAKSKRQESFEIYVPRKLVSGDYFLSVPIPSSITVNGTLYYGSSFKTNFTYQTTDDYYVLFPRTERMEELIQNTYLQDSIIEFSAVYRDTTSTDKLEKMYVNEHYVSISDALIKGDGTDVYTTPLTLDTTTTTKVGFTMTSSMKDQVHMAGTDVSNRIGITASPAYYNLRDVESTLEIPEEFLVKGITSENVAEIKTNKDRVIESSEISALGEDEYVKYIKLFGDLRHNAALEVTLDIHVRKTMMDGTTIASPTYAKVTGEASSTESIVNATSVSQSFKITNKVNDNVKIRNWEDERSVTRTGTLNAYLKQIRLIGDGTNLDTMIYKNAEIEITGDEILSLTDTIGFAETNAEEIAKFKVLYTTHLNATTREALPVKEGSMYYAKCDVGEGDYVTSLKICSTELDLCKERYDNSMDIYLKSSKLPEQLPFDGSSVDGKNYAVTVKFTADNTDKHRETEALSYTFKVPIDADILSVNDMSGTQVNCDKKDIELASIHLAKIDDSGRIIYENTVIDFTGTDPELLSMITQGVSMSGTEKHRISFNWYYSTNQREEVQHAFNLNGGSLDLKDGEYITSLKMVWDWNKLGFYPWEDVTVTLFGKPEIYSKITGQYIGDDYKSYTVKASFEADNKTKYLREGKSVSITGRSTVTANGMIGDVELSADKIYQGNSFEVSITPRISVENPGNRSFNVKNPVFYIEVDSRYSFETGSLAANTGTARATWEAGKLQNGNSILKVELLEYEKKFWLRTISVPLTFKLRAKPSVEPEKGIQPIQSLWADISETTTVAQPENYANVILENTVKDTAGIQDDKDKEFYTVATSVSGGQEILPVNEMGITSIGIYNQATGLAITGHDNDAYGQNLAIISNYDEPTKDWIVYIPIPKEGKTVHYKTSENGVTTIGETEPSQISMNLNGPVELLDPPSGTEITYSEDENPVFQLDGSDVGNYQASVSDWSKVTMVKIKIPEMAAREKIYPILNYNCEEKIKTGDFTSYGGVYFNVKVGDSPDYFFGDEGSYTRTNTYTIKDFKVSGYVWEEMGVPSDHVYTRTDKMKAGVKISTTDRNKETWSTTSGEDGAYTLVIPSHGDYDISIEVPDNEESVPEQKYTLVDMNKGTKENSSKFNPATAKISVTLSEEDIPNQNAGLWAERSIAVDPEDVYVLKGETIKVPANKFPNYVDVTYGQSEDTTIAQVSEDGVISGIKVGETKAEVSMPDGKGGTVTAEYTIHVVPKAPSGSAETTHLFEGQNLDTSQGVTLVDGDGNSLAVDDPTVTIDDSKVDTKKPGKYMVNYIIDDGYNHIEILRDIYVHGKVVITKPDDWTTKTGTEVTSLDGVSADYEQVQEDGTTQTVPVPVTASTGETFTKNTPGKEKVELQAEVTYEGAAYQAKDSYVVTFNDKPIITAPDSVEVKVGASAEEIAAVMNGTASMETADGTQNLTDKLIYEVPDEFDSSVPNSNGTVTLKVTDPDTGEVITKEVMVNITAHALIETKELHLVIGQAYDPTKDIRITDGKGMDVSVTPDVIVSDNVPIDADGNVTEIGEYEVKYEYTDSFGNHAEATRIVKVNGPLVLEAPDQHLRQETGGSYTPDSASAYYVNSKKETTPVTGTYDAPEVELEIIGLTQLKYTVVHPVSQESVEKDFKVFVHGVPIIEAEGDSIYTHQSTDSDVLVDVVKNGTGNDHKTPASAHVIYVKENGETQKIDLTSQLRYEVGGYTAKTQGSYPVTLTVSDAFYVLAFASKLAPSEVNAEVTVTVGDKSYDVTFITGENGTFEEGSSVIQQVVHGNIIDKVPTPKPEPGYGFDHWEDQDGNIVTDFNKYPITGDTTISGVFTAKEYTATWLTKDEETLGSIEGGTQTEEGIPYEEYATKDVTAVPASEDSEFLGWEYRYIPEGGTEPVTGFVEDYKQVKVLGNITFTAKFAEKVFVSIGTENGRVTAAKGTQAEEITDISGTSAMVHFTAEELEKEKGTVTLKYAANIHHHLSKITFRDTLGHQYTIYAKDGSTVTEGPDYEVGVQKAAGNITVKVDETEGTIQTTGIDTSFAFAVQFDADPTYKVEFFTEQDDPTSRVKVNDGLYVGNPVGDKPETDPVKEGYTFHGWSTDGTQAADKMYDENAKIQDADIAYYAIWEKEDSKSVENPPKKPSQGSNHNPVTKAVRTISSNMKPVKTGDATNIMLFVILLTGASLVLVGVSMVRRRGKKQ